MPEPLPSDAEPEITLEEWIASCQSCCGVEPESRRKPEPPAADDAPAADRPSES